MQELLSEYLGCGHWNVSLATHQLTLSGLVMPNGKTLECSGPYWSNPPFLFFGHSGRVPECQKNYKWWARPLRRWTVWYTHFCHNHKQCGMKGLNPLKLWQKGSAEDFVSVWVLWCCILYCSDQCARRRLLLWFCAPLDRLDQESSANDWRRDSTVHIPGVLHEETLDQDCSRQRRQCWHDIPLSPGEISTLAAKEEEEEEEEVYLPNN